MSPATDHQTEVFASRKQLEQERLSAYSASDLAASTVGRMEGRFAALQRIRIDAYADKGRGKEGAAERAEEIEQELADLEADLDRERAALEGAAQGLKHVEEELARLLKDELHVFAEDAERLTEEAREALAALTVPYMNAVAAWAAAEAAWAPLARAIEATIREHREADGIYSAGRGDAEAARVPEFPLPAPGATFERNAAGALSARPPAMQPADD